MGSEKAHVGYLCDTQTNPFVAKGVRNPFVRVLLSLVYWVCPSFGFLFLLIPFPNNSCFRNDLFLLRLYSVALNFDCTFLIIATCNIRLCRRTILH